MRHLIALFAFLVLLPAAALAQTAPGAPFWMSGAPASDAGDIACNQLPALTGDVTTSAGSCATTLAKIQGTAITGTTGTGKVALSDSPVFTTQITTPLIKDPSAGQGRAFFFGDGGLYLDAPTTSGGGYLGIQTNGVDQVYLFPDASGGPGQHEVSLQPATGVRYFSIRGQPGQGEALLLDTNDLSWAFASSIKPLSGNLIFGSGSALATNATAGFMMATTFAGTPTGAPTGGGAGASAFGADTTNHKWCWNEGSTAWQCTPLAILSGTTASIGGGALLAGQCSSGTVSITGATTSMVALADPNTYPGDGTIWDAQVTGSGTVTVKICAIVALSPSASTYNVRVLQ